VLSAARVQSGVTTKTPTATNKQNSAQHDVYMN